MVVELIQSYIGLGSNLEGLKGVPKEQLDKAVTSINNMKDTHIVNVSSYYETAPVGPKDQSDYLNAVVLIETLLPIQQLLIELQAIELDHDRKREQKWGARTLDLDILTYGDNVLNTPLLTVPHEQISQRSFVLIPLQEIAGDDFEIPTLGKIRDVISRCPENPIRKIISND